METHAAPTSRAGARRVLVVAVGLALAALPAACGTLGDGGASDEEDPSATTVFRTITVEFTTSTSAPPAVAGGTPEAGGDVTLGPNIYEVQSGDYWIGIAQELNVDLNALLAANNATTDTLLLPGKRLAVPQPGQTAAGGLEPPAGGGQTPAESEATPTLAPGSSPTSYQIVAGDYWIRIAEKLDVSLNALLNANSATTDTVLIPGKYLRVPQG